jgi:hypothetical protein
MGVWYFVVLIFNIFFSLFKEDNYIGVVPFSVFGYFLMF